MIPSTVFPSIPGLLDGAHAHPMASFNAGGRASSPVDGASRLPEDDFVASPAAAALSSAASARGSRVRMQKVAQLRAAIASGSYRVSPADLADAMMAAEAL